MTKIAREVYPDSINTEQIQPPKLGQPEGGKWHLLGSCGCQDGNEEAMDHVIDFVGAFFSTDTPVPEGVIPLSPYDNDSPDICRRCYRTISGWNSNRFSYTNRMLEGYDGGTAVTFTPLSSDSYGEACDICQKPSGATHQEQEYGQFACLHCVFELSDGGSMLGILREGLDKEDIAKAGNERKQCHVMEPVEVQRERRENQRDSHNEKRRHLPLKHTDLVPHKAEILADNGYETVGDILDGDHEKIGSIPHLGCYWDASQLPHTYTLDLTTFDGVGDKTAERLQDADLGTLPALEQATPEEIGEVKGLSEYTGEEIQRHIDSWKNN